MDRPSNYEDRHPQDRNIARDLWREIFDNLCDRGCFKGIDADVMEELEADLTGIISDKIALIKQTLEWGVDN